MYAIKVRSEDGDHFAHTDSETGDVLSWEDSPRRATHFASRDDAQALASKIGRPNWSGTETGKAHVIEVDPTMETPMTYAQFCTQHGIQIVATRTLRNPHMAEAKNAPPMDHWHVLLTCAVPMHGTDYRALRSMKLHFSKGSAHKGAQPTAAEVLESLALDAQTFGPECSGVTFDEWCGEYGFSSDSISALKAYQAAQSQSRRLRELVGPELFARLLSGEIEE